MPKRAKKPAKYIKTVIPLASEELSLYSSPRIATAWKDVTEDMTLLRGARLVELFEAIYKQGKKNGQIEAKEQFQVVIDKMPSKPGRPKA